MEQPIEVAVLMSDEKERKLRLMERVGQAAFTDVRFTRVELADLLESGSRYCAVLHKIHGDLFSPDAAAAERVVKFKSWLAKRGAGVIPIDPLEGLETMLLYRYDMCRAMSKCVDCDQLRDIVFVPRYAQIADGQSMTAPSSLRYPLLCKPHKASGSHDMTLVFCQEQLDKLQGPLVAQEFVNHGARLIKIYVLGDRIHACVRPSLRDFPPGYTSPSIHFSSHSVSKAGCRSELSADPAGDSVTDEELLARYADILGPLADRCRAVLGLDLINIDLVPQSSTGMLGLVDINQFPGFESMPGYVHALAELVRLKCRQVSAIDY